MAGEWHVHQVSDLLLAGHLMIGDGYRAKNEELSNQGIPFARVANVNGGFRFADADRFPEESLGLVGNKVSEVGDVVFTSKGTVGRFAFVRGDTPRFVYSPQLCFWRSLDESEVDPRFLYYWMSSREFYVQFKGVAGQTDMADFVSLGDQRRMQITLPPVSEQRAIAHILGTLDDKIELNRRMNETLEAMARALFKSWFVDFDPVRAKAEGRDPGLPVHLADLFPDSFEQSELGEIPTGWRIGILGEVAENTRQGIDPDKIDSTTPYIGLEHMPRKCIALSHWDRAGTLGSTKFKFKTGEFLFGKLRPYFHKVGVAPTNGVCSTDILVIVPKGPEWSGLVLEQLSNTDFVGYTSAGSTGTKMPRTNWHDMSQYPIVVPPRLLAAKFTEIVGPLVARITASIHESRAIASLRDALLPKLVSGELRVQDADRL